MSTCVVVLGGDPPDPSVVHHLPSNAFVIAADGGVDHAHRLGLPIHLAVGDFDSISRVGLDRLVATGTPIERFDQNKDASDGELALTFAAKRRPEQLVVVCGGGIDRLDHLLVTVAMLTNPALATLPIVSAWIGTCQAFVACERRPPVRWTAAEDTNVTLLAVAGPAHGVTTSGLEWPLADATLLPWSSWGLSNRALGGACSVTVASGSLLVLLPRTSEV